MNEDITQVQIDILNRLRKSSRSFVTIQDLADRMNLTANKTERCIAELENWGYTFDRNKKSGLRYASSPDVLFPHEIDFDLKTDSLGKNIFSFDRVGSTNVIAHKYAERGEPDGTLILAERQTAGKGRLGRNWHSPAKRGVYMSLIIRPEIPPTSAPGLSLVAALSVAQALRDYPRIKAAIKWPNDVLHDGRKLAGVLTELSAEVDRVKYVIIGIGINVNHELQEFPEELREKATSLKIVKQQHIDRVQIVRAVLLRLENHYHEYVKHGFKRLLKTIKSYSCVIGRQVVFNSGDEARSGKAIDIDPHGLLVVEVNGRKTLLSSGEVTLAEDYRS